MDNTINDFLSSIKYKNPLPKVISVDLEVWRKGSYNTETDVITLDTKLGKDLYQVFLHELAHSCISPRRVGMYLTISPKVNVSRIVYETLHYPELCFTPDHLALASEELIADYLALILVDFYKLPYCENEKLSGFHRVCKYCKVLENTEHYEGVFNPIKERFHYITGEHLEESQLIRR